jgi:acyl-CoA synthetase (AMP-forming)/AMP-acid ligase II
LSTGAATRREVLFGHDIARRSVLPVTTFDYVPLRDKWYREGWFSARTCLDAFDDGVAKHGSTPVTFVRDDQERIVTVAEIHRQALTLATALQRGGVGSGDAVAVLLTNRAECAVAYQAVLLCGAVLVPIVHIYGPAEVGFILTESRAKVLIMPERVSSTRYVERIPELSRIKTLVHVIVVDAQPDSRYLAWSSLTTTNTGYQRPTVASDDVCLLLYTSGTTSAPKGVQHTHNTVLAEQRTLSTLLSGAPDDVSLVSFPPGHIAGVGCILRPLFTGTRTVFMDSWNPAQAVDMIDRFAVTSTAGAPVHLQGLLDCAEPATLSTLREFLVGAAPVSEELGKRASAVGISTFRSYGSTEHPTVTGEHDGEPQWARLGTDAKALPGSEVRIVGPTGEGLPIGIDGEVVTQGPEQFMGYQDPELNDDAFTADGWFRTGDLGHLDADGRLTITDRIKDVIIRGGETISSNQVEDVLHSHPAVAEAAVVAAPDPRYGDVVGAVVVLRPDTAIDLESVRAHFAASGLAKQKTPERLAIVDALPRTALGKVRKADLRAEHFAG